MSFLAHMAWLRWRTGLAVGKAINCVAYRLLDAGWGLSNHSAQKWYRPEFTQWENRA